jgi:hypothetical protein
MSAPDVTSSFDSPFGSAQGPVGENSRTIDSAQDRPFGFAQDKS